MVPQPAKGPNPMETVSALTWLPENSRTVQGRGPTRQQNWQGLWEDPLPLPPCLAPTTGLDGKVHEHAGAERSNVCRNSL